MRQYYYYYYLLLFYSLPNIGLMVRMFVIPKTQKMVLDATLLNTQHYKVRIKVKWINPEKGVALRCPLHLCVVAIEKGAFGSPSTTVTNFLSFYLFLFLLTSIYVLFCFFVFFFLSFFLFLSKMSSCFSLNEKHIQKHPVLCLANISKLFLALIT